MTTANPIVTAQVAFNTALRDYYTDATDHSLFFESVKAEFAKMVVEYDYLIDEEERYEGNVAAAEAQRAEAVEHYTTLCHNHERAFAVAMFLKA